MAAELISMKITAAERKAMTEPAEVSKPEGPQYPWGLTLRLDDASIEKLGGKLPALGKTLRLEATVEVVEVVDRKALVGGGSRSCELQITAMALSVEKKDAAEALYGGDSGD